MEPKVVFLRLKNQANVYVQLIKIKSCNCISAARITRSHGLKWTCYSNEAPRQRIKTVRHKLAGINYQLKLLIVLQLHFPNILKHIKTFVADHLCLPKNK